MGRCPNSAWIPMENWQWSTCPKQRSRLATMRAERPGMLFCPFNEQQVTRARMNQGNGQMRNTIPGNTKPDPIQASACPRGKGAWTQVEGFKFNDTQAPTVVFPLELIDSEERGAQRIL